MSDFLGNMIGLGVGLYILDRTLAPRETQTITRTVYRSPSKARKSRTVTRTTTRRRKSKWDMGLGW